MTKNSLFVIGADKGGVGKTTVARSLLDYFAATGVPARAFDTEYPRGTLKRFFPDVTEVVDFTSVADQMRILDTIRTSKNSTVIDVRAGQLSPTLKLFKQVGLFDALKRADVNLIVLHVLGPSISSLSEIDEIASFVPAEKYILVKNFINDSKFFDWSKSTSESYFPNSRNVAKIIVPKLNELAYEQIERAGVSFLTFIANQTQKQKYDFSFVLRGYVRHWLAAIWGEFVRVNLLDLIDPAAAQSSAKPLQTKPEHMTGMLPRSEVFERARDARFAAPPPPPPPLTAHD